MSKELSRKYGEYLVKNKEAILGFPEKFPVIDQWGPIDLSPQIPQAIAEAGG